MSDAYGLWVTVGVDTLLVGWGAAGVFHPRSRTDWKALGGMWAFIVAVFTEMYGFPLTVYLLEGPLGSRFPQIQPTFAGGHLWNDLIGWRSVPQLSPFHLASYVFILGGFWLTAIGWPALWRAARANTLAVDGPYSWIRHPQYTGFGLVMTGFLLQWPTIPTLIMFPMLVLLCRRLAIRENASKPPGSVRTGPITYKPSLVSFLGVPDSPQQRPSHGGSSGAADPVGKGECHA